MKIIGHGIDLTAVARVARLLRDHPDTAMNRLFTAREQAYAGDGKRRDERLAVRFAAKEAVLKALRTGWSQGIAWTEVEVTLEASGAPGIVLSGKALEIAAAMGVTGWQLSLTHTEGFAMASAIAVGE